MTTAEVEVPAMEFELPGFQLVLSKSRENNAARLELYNLTHDGDQRIIWMSVIRGGNTMSQTFASYGKMAPLTRPHHGWPRLAGSEQEGVILFRHRYDGDFGSHVIARAGACRSNQQLFASLQHFDVDVEV